VSFPTRRGAGGGREAVSLTGPAVINLPVLIPFPRPSIFVVKTGILRAQENCQHALRSSRSLPAELKLVRLRLCLLVAVELVLDITTNVNSSHVGLEHQTSEMVSLS
jgi:hypothetical protein